MCRHATPVGVVLAGGASSRMGRDKALLGLSGSSLVERAAAKLAAVCDEVLLADGGRETLAGHRSVADHPARGPAAGILGAAAAGRPGRTVGDELLAVHRSYLGAVAPLLEHDGLHALAHITGGGLTDNLPRVLPPQTHATIKLGAWEIPHVFHLLQDEGGVSTDEMLRVFNMGIGMVLVVGQAELGDVLERLRAAGEKGSLIGSVGEGGRGVVYDFPGEPERDVSV